eukprot:CAMPEP_0119415434 /NCGR_PEP_ID=MMETSP1335-20130426/9161_1 /TAXON_ID=259385 /ORGANISM="Chrysoculter rhomboideus, Strain RCC1486" /LENGTH=38 /DNA_ID= /DNA_START= /DNA_END= /DNA_ORIENTATION=
MTYQPGKYFGEGAVAANLPRATSPSKAEPVASAATVTE